VTAKTTDDTVVYNEQRIYMPFPGRFGRGKEMGRGPYEKSGGCCVKRACLQAKRPMKPLKSPTLLKTRKKMEQPDVSSLTMNLTSP
jgi:hypothetical protein